MILKLKKINFNVDTEKILKLNKIFSGEENYKFLIGHLCDYCKAKPLHVIHPKRNTYVTNYDGQSKWMYLLIENDELLERYNNI